MHLAVSMALPPPTLTSPSAARRGPGPGPPPPRPRRAADDQRPADAGLVEERREGGEAPGAEADAGRPVGDVEGADHQRIRRCDADAGHPGPRAGRMERGPLLGPGTR